MFDKGFLLKGETKILDIDFSIAIPASSYYASVNMLIEFTPFGQVIPTRIEVLPYKLSPFASFKEDLSSFYDQVKILLVLYTVKVVVQDHVNQYKKGKIKGVWDFICNVFSNVGDNIVIFF